jgi:hypothetical protein
MRAIVESQTMSSASMHRAAAKYPMTSGFMRDRSMSAGNGRSFYTLKRRVRFTAYAATPINRSSNAWSANSSVLLELWTITP